MYLDKKYVSDSSNSYLLDMADPKMRYKANSQNFSTAAGINTFAKTITMDAFISITFTFSESFFNSLVEDVLVTFTQNGKSNEMMLDESGVV